MDRMLVRTFTDDWTLSGWRVRGKLVRVQETTTKFVSDSPGDTLAGNLVCTVRVSARSHASFVMCGQCAVTPSFIAYFI